MGNKKIFYILLLVLILVVLFQSSVFLQEVLRDYTDSLIGFEKTNPLLAVALFVIFAVLSVLIGPFSSFPLIPPAIAIWGLPATFGLLYLGWLIGNTAAYLIGRYFGRPLVNTVVGEIKVNNWIRSIEKKLSFAVLLLFRLATPAETGYAFGIIKYAYEKYLLICLIAELPFAILAVYASEAFSRSNISTLFGLIWVWVMVIILAFYFFRKTSR